MTLTRILTADTVKVEQIADYIKQDWYGDETIRAGWSTAFGPVSRVFFLQAVEQVTSVPDPPAVPEGLSLESRERTWLNEVSPFREASEEIKILELRTYDVRFGLGSRFVQLLLGALPIRQRYSANYGVWRSLSGRQDQVLHLWGYRSFEERDQVRGRLKTDVDWDKYVSTILPMLQVLNSTVLVPLPTCPGRTAREGE